MNQLSILLELAFLLNYFAIVSAECPSPGVLHPCKCEASLLGVGDNIKCKIDNSNFDLKAMFLRVSENTEPNKRHFRKLTIEDKRMESIEADVLGKITFEEIDIHSTNSLKRIHSKAFASTSITLKYFTGIFKSGNYTNQPPNYGTFEMLNSLVDVETIEIYPTKVADIPERAFQLEKLKRLFYHSGDEMPLTISDYAFSRSSNLIVISLNDCGLKWIPKKALHFEKESLVKLMVFFDGNQLNESSFENEAFTGFKRPTNLEFSINNIKYLKESVFRPFLDADEGNSIEDLSKNPINCTDCRNYWLVKHKDKYESRVLKAYCNGQKVKDIFDQQWNCPNF